MTSKIRVAVIGVGHLGRFHAQKYASLNECVLTALVDRDAKRLQTVSHEIGVPGFERFEEILDRVDAVSIAVQTPAHYEVAKACLQAGKHVLVEKPLAATVVEAQELVTLANRKQVLLQVGYLERFNPAYVACRPRIKAPHYIETIRIHSFLERGSDVDVVLDLMSHDLDLVLSMVGSPVRQLHAVGLSLMTQRTDLANVRLMFENGAVANLTASRISRKAERKMRLFQKDSYMSLDLALPGAKVYSASPQEPSRSPVNVSEEVLDVKKGDALLVEIQAFLHSIANGTPPAVSGEEGLKAMAVAEQIIRDISNNRIQ
jgi:predicted dehydrogenase